MLLMFVIVSLLVCSTHALTDPSLPDIFYPFGTDVGDDMSPPDDDGTYGYTVADGFKFYGKMRRKVYVNTNGILSFDANFTSYIPTGFPTEGVSAIAPYWADIITSGYDGRIYHRQVTNDVDLLSRASQDVQSLPSEKGTDFEARWLFIATWYNVSHYGLDFYPPTQSFQAVLITDGERSFVMFNYGNLTWSTGSQGGEPAQIGFNEGDGRRSYTVPAAKTHHVINVWKTTNVGQPGRWILRIDYTAIRLDEDIERMPESMWERGGNLDDDDDYDDEELDNSSASLDCATLTSTIIISALNSARITLINH